MEIQDKAIETKLDKGVEIMKRIALLHSIIIDVEDLRDFSSNDCGRLDANIVFWKLDELCEMCCCIACST